MRLSFRVLVLVLPALLAIAGCATEANLSVPRQPLTLELNRIAARQVTAEYLLRESTNALHFPQELGGYRSEVWRPVDPAFRWVVEGGREHVERIDGQPFRRIAFVIAIDYRALPKSYAPFSPFSEGSALVHSGQFHACVAAPCEQPLPLPIRIKATGATIGVEGRRTVAREQFVSREEGTNIFVGTLGPVESNDFIAIIDPGLPVAVQEHLDRSLPAAIQDFAAIYGPLSFKPELYVSIDDEPEKAGRISTQGGTLPKQIFMHFDGENAKERVGAGNALWLDWFFAHEAAHLFQQDKSGKLIGDDRAAWMHEGAADAMAALAMVRRGSAERAYVLNRVREAEKACAAGLAATPLNRASDEGKFDLHYQCGLMIWLALEHDFRRGGCDGINDLNRALFAAVRGGEQWSEPAFFKLSVELGASHSLMMHIDRLLSGNSTDAVEAVASLGQMAEKVVEPKS